MPITKNDFYGNYFVNATSTSGGLDEITYNPSTFGSLQFDGSTGYLTIPNNAALQTGSNDFTLECWIYLTSLPANNGSTGAFTILQKGYIVGNSLEFVFGILQTGGSIDLSFQQSTNGTTATNYTSNPITGFTTNTWYHVAITKSSSTVTYWVNGVSYGTSSVSSSNYSSVGSVGIGNNPVGGNAFFPGYIANLRLINGTAIYTTTFTPPTSLLLPVTNTALLLNTPYTLDAFKDSSTNAFTVTQNGSVTSIGQTPLNLSGYYGVYSANNTANQSNQPYLSTTAGLIANNNFGVQCWFYLTSFANNSTIFAQGANTSDSLAFTCYVNATSGLINTRVGSQANTNYVWGSIPLVLNQWYHLSCVSNATSFNVVLNGNVQSSAAIAVYTNTASNTAGQLVIGTDLNRGSSAQYMKGYISNFKVSNTANVSLALPTGPYTADSNTVLLTAQSSKFIDNSINGYTVTANGLIQIASNPQPFTSINFANTNLPVSKSYSNSTVQLSGTIDELTNNPISYGSLQFANTKWLSAAANSALAFGSNPFTIEAWIYPTTITTGWSIYEQRSVYPTSNGIYFQLVGASGNVAFRTNNNTLYSGNLVAPNNTWTHVALTKNSSNVINVWVNGQKSTANLTYNTALSDNSGIYIGRTTDNNVSYIANGYISNLRVINGNAIYTAAFTPPTQPLTPVANTVLLLNTPHTADAFKDSSVVQNPITVVNAVASSPSTPLYPTGNYSVFFNGSSQYLYPTTSPTAFGNNDFTIEMFVSPSSLSSTQYLYDERGSTTDNAPWILLNSNGSIQWGDYHYAWNSSGSLQNNGTWSHIALSRSANTLYLFLNGIQQNVAYTATGANLTYTIGTSKPSISYSVAAITGYYNGYISNIRRINGNGLYSNNFNPPSNPFTPTTNTTLLIAQSNRFIDTSSSNLAINTVATPIIYSNPTPFGFGFVYYANSGIPVSKTYSNGSIAVTNVLDEVSLNANLSATVLVVGGGGGGGAAFLITGSGGGGAGGVVSNTITLNPNTIYTVSVGSGGFGQIINFVSQSNGVNSSFVGTGVTITALGGGYGANGGGSYAGGSGGSGGGGGSRASGCGTGGAGGVATQPASPSGGYGHAGATAPAAVEGGGGGGAGAVGSNVNGGAGVANPIGCSKIGQSSSCSYYVGGGGSGSYIYPYAGGVGGGGFSNTCGSNSLRGGCGANNTGGGGGGGGYGTSYGGGGNGGSGVVIVSYPGPPVFAGGNITITPGCRNNNLVGNTIHTFICTPGSILYPTSATNVYNAQLLVVGGGGGGQAGGSIYGGGGGSGAVVCKIVSLGVGNTVTIVVGAGGAGATVGNASGANGINSVVSGVLCGSGSYTALGGAGGGGTTGIPGGSGGGAPNGGTATHYYGVSIQYVLGYGFGGCGGGSSLVSYGGSGGGGAGGGGGNSTGTLGGAGGSGKVSLITGCSVTYAGGGAGASRSANAATGGSGGGGNGGTSTTPAGVNAAGYGSGGGGGSNTNSGTANGGNGSNGVVIIAYSGSQRFSGGIISYSGGNTIHTFTSNATITV